MIWNVSSGVWECRKKGYYDLGSELRVERSFKKYNLKVYKNRVGRDIYLGKSREYVSLERKWVFLKWWVDWVFREWSFFVIIRYYYESLVYILNLGLKWSLVFKSENYLWMGFDLCL